MHANYPSIVGLEPPVNHSWSTLSYEELKEQERQAFEALRAAAAIPRTRAHLVEGNPAREIPRTARQLGAAIVVMGALSRSGLQRVFIGNTAERVLGSLNCDVLVVKPEEIAPRVARQSRGLRVVAPATALVS
jgi:universal stress protein E